MNHPDRWRAPYQGMLLLSLALSAVACKRDKPELSKENVPREPVAPPEPGATQIEAPVEEPPPPEARQAVTGPPIETSVVLAAKSTRYAPMRLHSLQGALLVTQDADVYTLEEGKLVLQRLEFSGNRRVSEYHHIEGTWPAPLAGTAGIGELFTGDRGDHYEFQSGHFIGAATGLSQTAGELAPSAWSRGRVLGWRPARFIAYGGSSDAVLPEMPLSDCGAEIWVRTIAAMADGTVYAAGFPCSSQEQLMVGRWADGRTDGVIEVLRSRRAATPSTKLRLVRGATRVALLATTDKQASVWRLEQDGWRELLLPHVPELESAVVAPDGSLWLLVSGSPNEPPRALRLRDDELSEVRLPSESELRAALGEPAEVEALSLHPTSVGHRGETIYLASQVILGVDKRIGHALLEVSAGQRAASEADQEPAPEPSAGTACPQPLVVLYAVSPTTAADYDYPATRDAVAGSEFAKSAEFLEVTRAGKRTLVARLASRRAADALASRIRERVPGSRPAVVCEEITEVLRKVPIH